MNSAMNPLVCFALMLTLVQVHQAVGFKKPFKPPGIADLPVSLPPNAPPNENGVAPPLSFICNESLFPCKSNPIAPYISQFYCCPVHGVCCNGDQSKQSGSSTPKAETESSTATTAMSSSSSSTEKANAAWMQQQRLDLMDEEDFQNYVQDLRKKWKRTQKGGPRQEEKKEQEVEDWTKVGTN